MKMMMMGSSKRSKGIGGVLKEHKARLYIIKRCKIYGLKELNNFVTLFVGFNVTSTYVRLILHIFNFLFYQKG
ncbi:hypothetical protein HanRHA438_Chr12g0546691 [Helianthus annuus]|nr:hypothetical protein HanRHA438_Chr12g0546691 [Helianthus annuus]